MVKHYLLILLLLLISTFIKAECPKGCWKCSNNNECLLCNDYYVLSNEKKCIHCGDECRYCTYDEKTGDTTCISCASGLELFENKCHKRIRGCSSQILNENSEYKNESICLDCGLGYALDSNKLCTLCGDFPELGEGCSRCSYNKNSDKYECLYCENYYNYQDNTFINNEFTCFNNYTSENSYLSGCLQAYYNNITKKYECIKCKVNYNRNFILIENQKTCYYFNRMGLSSNCLQFENISTTDEEIYSCMKCKNDFTLIQIDNNGKKDCYERKDNLQYCFEGKIGVQGKYICTQCVENAKLNDSNICECDYNSFSKLYECYKCSDEINGNPGCNIKKGCYYDNSKN